MSRKLLGDFKAHLAGGAAEGAECRFFRAGIHVFHFDFDDVHHLFLGDFTDLRFVGFLGSRSKSGCLFEKDGGGRRLRDEGEGFVFVNGDNNREDVSRLLLRGRVKFFAECHDVHALLTEGWAYGWSGVGRAGGNLQFDLSYDFFSHMKNVSAVCAEKSPTSSRPRPVDKEIFE